MKLYYILHNPSMPASPPITIYTNQNLQKKPDNLSHYVQQKSQVTSPSPTNLTLAYTRLRPNSASATYINGYQSSTTVHTLSITQLYNTPHPLPPINP